MTTIRTKAFDMKGVKLSAEEGFVLSRVAGAVSLHELVDMSGLPEERIVEILRRLVAEGTIDVEPPLAPAEPASVPSAKVAPASRSSVPSAKVAPASRSSVPSAKVAPASRPSVRAASLAPAAPASRPSRSFASAEPAPSSRSFAAAPAASRSVAPAAPAAPPPAPAPVAAGHPLAVCALTDVGVARSNNEDAFCVMDLTTAARVEAHLQAEVALGPRGMLLVVCDGMGGENAGEVASALAVEVVSTHLAMSRDEDPAAALRAAVDHANELVVSAADEPGRKGMGTTLVALLIQGEDAFTAEVGDSRAYVLRGGELTQITKDQTYVQLLLDQGLMTLESMKGSVAKNVVLQALGKAPELIVAQRRLGLRGGDRLLVCSDGLSSYVTDAEICAVLTSNDSLHASCAKLVAMANDRGGHDNVTVVAALVSEALAPPGANDSVSATLTTLRAYAVGEGESDNEGADGP